MKEKIKKVLCIIGAVVTVGAIVFVGVKLCPKCKGKCKCKKG